MSNQVERFIEITNDNYTHLLKVWDNVKRREIDGDSSVKVSLGIDFKERNRQRKAARLAFGTSHHDDNDDDDEDDEEETQEAVHQENHNTSNENQETPSEKHHQQSKHAPQNLFNESSSSEDDGE